MQPQFTQKDVDRFWSKVDRSGGDDACWLWMGSKRGTRGHGGFRLDGKVRGAHRVSYYFCHGVWPDLCVCHNCPGGDNAGCVNPNHLWLGTNAENIEDAVKKGVYRGERPRVQGERNPQAKLTESKVRAIRDRYATGTVSLRRVADEFGIDYRNVHEIVSGKRWSSVH